jgi:hypothetical protein
MTATRSKPDVTSGQSSDPVYVAARKMKRNGETIKVGDVIPDALAWPRLESWVRAGYLKEQPHE